VPLPKIGTRHSEDVLHFEHGGRRESELKYCHFSVVMSKSRRQCFFSACNIDGETSVPMKRTGWKLDPRIPSHAQIMQECYGSHPKFSRGHMTRREDPIWGEGDEPSLGNKDSMHVTNTVPQMQNMNAGIWLALENYALKNARKDEMKISVFTGPVFGKKDGVRYGVKIPMSFWKVIAFIHDDSKKLCSTGYLMSQTEFLPEEEFIYGQHKTAQVPISQIETLSGLSFGDLKTLDPMRTVSESIAAAPLRDLTEIKFF
jgi:endonuclease G, mitochondrial